MKWNSVVVSTEWCLPQLWAQAYSVLKMEMSHSRSPSLGSACYSAMDSGAHAQHTPLPVNYSVYDNCVPEQLSIKYTIKGEKMLARVAELSGWPQTQAFLMSSEGGWKENRKGTVSSGTVSGLGVPGLLGVCSASGAEKPPPARVGAPRPLSRPLPQPKALPCPLLPGPRRAVTRAALTRR